MKKNGCIVLALLCLITMLAGCGKKEEETASPYLHGKHRALLAIQDYGTITLELDADAAPITVTNFVELARSGFYDGLTFHRIMEGFMMQGGDPKGNGTGGSENPIRGEFSANGVENPLSHVRGVISMARAQSYNSASSQFFIVHQDSTFLDGSYAAFGRVTDGMEIVDAICTSVPVVDDNGKVLPEDQPVIQSVQILLEGKHHVEIEVAEAGTIQLELDADAAPITVTNFVGLARSGFYDGLTFHRIMEGFMMQGGDPTGNGTGGSDVSIPGEFQLNGYENPLSHVRGVISMARAQPYNSASSQFFIVHQDSAFLDGSYAAFGRVTDGMDVVDAICAAAKVVDDNGKVLPEDQPVITAIRVID